MRLWLILSGAHLSHFKPLLYVPSYPYSLLRVMKMEPKEGSLPSAQRGLQGVAVTRIVAIGRSEEISHEGSDESSEIATKSYRLDPMFKPPPPPGTRARWNAG